jgi:hypothetical protein
MRLVKRPTLLLIFCGALGLAACGGGDDGDDGADDGTTDGTDDGGDDGGVNPDGENNTYVINDVGIPTDANQAAQLSLNIDDMSGTDHKLSDLLALLAGQTGLDIQGAVSEEVARGGIILLANLQATDLTNATGVGLSVYLGADPDPAPCTDPKDPKDPCGLHLDGSGSFSIDADSPEGIVLVGENVNGQFSGGPGEVTIELSLSQLADPLVIRLIGARVEAGVAADGLSSGILGGAITIDDINNVVLPGLADLIASLLEADGCTTTAPCCPADSTGEAILNFLDEDDDCLIPVEELQDSSLLSSTIGEPDVDLLDGDEFAPNTDGVRDSISLGFGFSAVSGTFTVP